MSNTGVKIYHYLKQIDTTTGLPTGLRKPNVPADPDYVPPTTDYTTCPVQTWQPINPACEVVSDANTGYKIFMQRQRLTNGVVDGYSEDNLNGVGLGPYFAPVYDPVSCPLPEGGGPPPPPPPTVRITSDMAGISLIAVNNLLGFALSGPINPGGLATGTHGAFTAAIQIQVTGTPIFNPSNVFIVRNGTTLNPTTPLHVTGAGLYSFATYSFLATDTIEIQLNLGT